MLLVGLLLLLLGFIAAQEITENEEGNPPEKVLYFSYSNCGTSLSLPEVELFLTLFRARRTGSPSDPTKLTKLVVSPDPIELGENITVVASGYLSTFAKNLAFNMNRLIEVR